MEAIRATLSLNELRDEELAALTDVFEELANPGQDLGEQVAAVLIVPVLDAFRTERLERSAGRRTDAIPVELQVPAPMKEHLLAFFDGLVAAIQGGGGGSVAAVFAPLVTGIRLARAEARPGEGGRPQGRKR